MLAGDHQNIEKRARQLTMKITWESTGGEGHVRPKVEGRCYAVTTGLLLKQ